MDGTAPQVDEAVTSKAEWESMVIKKQFGVFVNRRKEDHIVTIRFEKPIGMKASCRKEQTSVEAPRGLQIVLKYSLW